jgi:molecular chaperone DnaJ
VGTRTRRGPRRTRVARGEDAGVLLSLTFEEAAFGKHTSIDVERLAACNRCMGSGAEPGTSPIACRRCGGSGEVQEVRRSIFGTIMTAATCGTCAGTGEEIPDKCEACFGEGRVRRAETIEVDVPAGVADGVELRVGGAGHAGRGGGPAGDLHVSLRVEPSLAFDRRGQDLFAVLDVPYTLASLGGDVEVSTLDGDERIRIEPGTESGEVIRLKGEGVPNLNRRGRGDLFVTVHVTVPGEISRDERHLLEQLAELRGERTSKKEPRRGTLRRHDALR